MPVSRRSILKGSGLAGLLVLLPAGFLEASARSLGGEHPDGLLGSPVRHRPGGDRPIDSRPSDDPSEEGHPGAREANVTRYIESMLGALSFRPAEIFAGGPFSNRAGSSTDDMATFIGLTPAQAYGWSTRLARLRVSSTSRASPSWTVWPEANSSGPRPRPRTRSWPEDPNGFTTLLVHPRHRRDVLGSRVRGERRPGRMARDRLPRGPTPRRVHGDRSLLVRRTRCLRTLRHRGAAPRPDPVQLVARALVIGSGPGGSIAAMVLAERGWDVTVFEKGPNYFDDLTSERPRTLFSNDELKHDRHFAKQDPDTEPRVYRTSASDPKPQVGIVQSLAQTVGGGTAHWDAKTPAVLGHRLPEAHRSWDRNPVRRSSTGRSPMPRSPRSTRRSKPSSGWPATSRRCRPSQLCRMRHDPRTSRCPVVRPSTPPPSWRKGRRPSDSIPSWSPWPSTVSPTAGARRATTADSAWGTAVRSWPESGGSHPCAARCSPARSSVPSPQWSR